MKKGTKVSWQAPPPGATAEQVSQDCFRGNGVTITDEDTDGTILVAVNSLDGGIFPAYHLVIHCTVTWLTVE